MFDLLRQRGKHIAIIAFGDYLKLITHLERNISYEKLFRDKDTNSRLALQTIGSDKRAIDPNFFTKALVCQIRMLFDRKVDVILISDARYRNEISTILDTGYSTLVIRVDAINRTREKVMKECGGNEQEYEKISTHSSETELDTAYSLFNHVINNDIGYETTVQKEMEKIVTLYRY
jgi:hypothetical protein